MDIFFAVLGGLFMLAGIAGSVLPVLPGPPLSLVGLLLLQLQENPPFTTNFLLIWTAITIGVVLIDYFIPAYGTKKFGGTKWGVWGTFVGLIVGLFFSPIGIIIGPLLGALIGELIAGKSSGQAFKAAIGSFVGFILGTVLKLGVCLVMTYYYIDALL
ncbi:hypothetical protein C900_03767 [Fulvivirga imtechensis AK7]|uniref:Uncharacterized protein n=1 Tax=Fulvivirga imtechensis AK7 TaxID=1237149 RepID=L8JQD1_9BACT|nr:DUF456 domain-containing protein [Fulvivirga imtechensis]ELR70413.1 hypothetical protein C900_03767 [Fulvivirga imtechensis AK7]